MKRGEGEFEWLYKPTFELLMIDFCMLGGGRCAYITCSSRVEKGSWYDNLVRAVLGHRFLWRRAQLFWYIHCGLLLAVNWMLSMRFGFH